jgi:3,4-dihydroxy-2-butanone 4-phosphate synthase
LADPTSTPSDFAKPGHIFPLRYTPGGVLRRGGHTEAAVDLCKLAGKKSPVGVICEINMDDGKMARRDDLMIFARAWGIKMCTISAMIEYRIQKGLVENF